MVVQVEPISKDAAGRAGLLWTGVIALLLISCASPRGGWDAAALEAEHPGVSTIKRQRISDTPPFLIPVGNEVALFLCRWSTDEEIPVALPADANESERIAVRKALEAWQNAGLGVRFRESSRLSSNRGIEIKLFAAGDETFPLARTGDTIADCRLRRHARRGSERLPDEALGGFTANLEWASIFMRRANFDSLGRSVPLSRAQLAGQVLHELGHALGFSGHVAVFRSIMTRTHEVAKHWGEGVMAGRPFSDPHLRALYSVPSGSVVEHLTPSPERVASLSRFMALAPEESSWAGPFVRVGERDARIFWKREAEANAVFEIRDWVEVVRGKADFALRVGPVAQRMLDRDR